MRAQPSVDGIAKVLPDPTDEGHVPAHKPSFELPPPLWALAAFVLVCSALTFLHVATPILNPVLLAVFLVTLALPLYRWLAAHKVRMGLALLVLMVVMLGVGLSIAFFTWLSVNRLAEGLQTYSGSLAGRVQELAGHLQAAGLPMNGSASSAASNGATSLLAAIVGGLVTAVSQFGIAVVLATFLLLEARRFGSLLTTSLRDLPFIGMTPQVMQAAVQYFFICIRLNILTGVLFGVALLLLGVDYALLWGIITVFLSFVPYIGLVVAATPATLLALAEHGPLNAVLVVLVVVVINTVIENVVAPSYTGKSLSLSASVVFVSFLFWVWLLGPLGALLAMPITVLLMLTFARYEGTRWVAQLIAGDELPPV